MVGHNISKNGRLISYVNLDRHRICTHMSQIEKSHHKLSTKLLETNLYGQKNFQDVITDAPS